MRQKNAPRPKNAQIELPTTRCKDCAHSYDWHSKALDGHLILCRCPFDVKTGHGKWCKFLTDRQCEHFKQRTDNGKAE